MTRRLALLLVGLVSLAGCPDDPYKASSWTKKLGGREHERAVQELEQLGDPSAIEDLGRVWENQGKQPRELEVIISLARPLSPDEAKAKFRTDFEASGRPANWDKALPFLIKAITGVDENNPRSVEGAMKAAEALGEAKLSPGLDALIDMAQRPISKQLIQPQIASIRAMGKFAADKDKASAALVKLIDREGPQHPRTVKDKEQMKAAEEKYRLYLATTGSAINSLGELRIKTATKTLVIAMYRTPELFEQIRRALVATGPGARDALLAILQGKKGNEHADAVDALFRDKKLDKYCGDKGDALPDQCLPVSIKQHYAAIVLGDFYDAAVVPDLLAVLKQPAQPAYYIDEEAGPTQHNAVFDALRKIGAPSAAQVVRDLWMPKGKGGPAPKGKAGKVGGAAPPPPGAGDALMTKILAISAYPFVTRDNIGIKELGEIAADNSANDDLRREAATAFARLSRNRDDIKVLEGLANKYFEASAKKRAEADGKPKAAADEADKVFAKQKASVEELKKQVLLTTRDTTKTAADIKAASKAAKKAEDDLKVAKAEHRKAAAPFKQLDNLAKGYKGIARMFQTHIARIEVAIRCQNDLKCYAGTLSLKPDDAVKNLTSYIKDISQWTKDEKLMLLEGNVERAMLELGKAGDKASGYADLLLDNAKSDNRLIRQSILLALPKIAKIPCANCEQKLDAAIKAGEGKTTVAALQLDTQMLRNYFAYAGGRNPSVVPLEKAPEPDKK